MKAQPYMKFNGQARQAFQFYQSVLGGEIRHMMKMSEQVGSNGVESEDANRLLHISLAISENVVLMASDMPASKDELLVQGNNLCVSLHPDTKEDAERIFNGLSQDGKIETPIAYQFWGDLFGSFIDKYGIYWMINYTKL